MHLNFRTNVTIEADISRNIGALLHDRYEACLIVIDEGFSDTELGLSICSSLLSSFDARILKTKSSNEPTYDDLRIYISTAEFDWLRSNLENAVLIGVGGGSAMDLAKVLAALATNPGDPLEYRGFDKVINPPVDAYLIPTTAGTGSESSFNASLIDSSANKKMGINGINMFAKGSFLDPKIMLKCPRPIALSAAVDAFVHCVEAFICKGSNPVSDGLAEKGLELIWTGLRVFEGEWDNIDHWQNLMLGAHIGGIVQMNSGSGIAAAISYPLGVYHGVPHGIGGAIFAPGVMKWNYAQGVSKYENLDRISGGSFVEKTVAKFSEIGVPGTLSQFNIFKHDKPRLIEIMSTQQPAFDQNPLNFSVGDDFSVFINEYLEDM